jgi:hypothetical protein
VLTSDGPEQNSKVAMEEWCDEKEKKKKTGVEGAYMVM